jgi:hypothetical protein
MDLLLHKDLILSFFKNLNKIDMDENDYLVERIMKNVNNNILLSRNILNYLKEIITEDDPIRDYFEQYILKIISERRVNYPPPSDSYNYEEEFIYLYKKYIGNFVVAISLFDYKYLAAELPNIASFVLINKPNTHWIITNLAANNPLPITVRYYDFNSDHEIEVFLKNIFHLPRNIKEISIFDRNCNLNHNLFSVLIGKGILINYYTAKKQNLDTERCKQEIRRKFISNYCMYTTYRDKIHERRIVFENIIIDTDEDFWNLEVSRPTWKIDISYCELTAKELLKKRSFFKRY